MGVEAILLDVAGTCIDFGSCAPVEVFKELFKRKGVVVSSDDARKPMGTGKREHLRLMLQESELKEKWEMLHEGNSATDEDIDQMYAEMEPLALEILPQYAIPITGVVKSLFNLKKSFSVKLGLTTGYNRKMLDVSLSPNGLAVFPEKLIDVTIAVDEVKEGRPAPYMLFRCMEELGIYKPSNCVVVGDTVLDIEAGLNAGMWTVGVATSGNLIGCSEDEYLKLSAAEKIKRLTRAREIFFSAGAHYVIEYVSSLEPVIKEINYLISTGTHPLIPYSSAYDNLRGI